jgi:hypothetical protein
MQFHAERRPNEEIARCARHPNSSRKNADTAPRSAGASSFPGYCDSAAAGPIPDASRREIHC